ncbi:cell surface protein, partial [Lacticaseibacillus rhamnosus]
GMMLLLINIMGLSFWRGRKDKGDENEKANP